MAEKRNSVKRAAEALLSDDSSALTVGGGVLFDVVFDGIRQHEQRRNASKGVSKRQPWADELAGELADAHPDLPTLHLCADKFLPKDDGERRYAGYEVWLSVDEKERKVLRADKYGERPKPITVKTFLREYLGPAHRQVKSRRGK